MIYFFSNIMMYLIILTAMFFYFNNKISIYSFLLLLFNVNVYTFFIYLKIDFLYGILCAIVTILTHWFYSYLKGDDKEIILVKNGNINFHELLENYSYQKLINYLKIRNIKLWEIKYCIKKNNHLIIIKDKDIKSFPINIIIDGKIIEENLEIIKKDKEWLARKLLDNRLLIKNVDYAYFKNNNIYFVK